ncbi:hypothetical protein XYCOK13_24950 [Xylanibacillus composti]|uniref:Uncharacterized protein n=2 Tax=Xylanibacillus composti TaxID=1572762 RepID=A0A8J4H4W4_9BACL|nr:hypothetical protein XYCOK13_24950 [Xylanibacillus composti]
MIGLLLVIVLIINQNFKLRSEMEAMHNRLSNLESNVNQAINHASYTLINQVENVVNEQQSMVTNYKSMYKAVHTQTKTLQSLVAFTLKQADEHASVFLRASIPDNSVSNEYECATSNGLDYSCEVELAYTDNYVLDMYQRSDDGSYKKLNTSSYPHHAKSDMDNRIHVTSSGTGTNKESTDYTFTIRNKTFGEPDLKMKSVVVKAFYEGEEVVSKDVTGHNIANAEARDRINLMIASGEMDPAAVPEVKYGDIAADEHGDEYGNYMVSVFHAETGAPVEHDDFPEYLFKVIVTLHNGEVFEF